MQAQSHARTRVHILIVDPDAEFADMVAQAISDAGGTYSVAVDTNTQEAVTHVREARAAQRPYDLLIADVRTPGAESMRMIEELAQSYPELKIVTMTAYHSPELAARVQQLNVHTHLVKPVAPSQFRQLVRNALVETVSGLDPASPPPPLADAQQAAVERQLANLRRVTGSTAAFLVHASGKIRAIDCLESDLDTHALGVTLMDAQRSIAQTLAQAMQTQDPIQQSYFGTASYSICVHRLDEKHAVATIFGPEVREGQMWYAMREGIETLQEALDTEQEESPQQPSSARSHGFTMVERYFAEQATPQTRPRRTTRKRSSQPPARAIIPGAETPTHRTPPAAEDSRSQDPPAPEKDFTLPSAPAPLEMERLKIDEIDWEPKGAQDWDTLVADTDQSFLGMSFEEAKKRGLLDDLDAD